MPNDLTAMSYIALVALSCELAARISTMRTMRKSFTDDSTAWKAILRNEGKVYAELRKVGKEIASR